MKKTKSKNTFRKENKLPNFLKLFHYFFENKKVITVLSHLFHQVFLKVYYVYRFFYTNYI